MAQTDEADPFLQHMFARMSPGARDMFSAYQIDEIKRAFSARAFGAHAVEFRRSVRLFGKAYYIVLLAGRERRSRASPASAVPGTILVITLALLAGFIIYTQW